MRKTGSRDPRESLEASATSLFSMAVKTFSIRFGSRFIQRPNHQKIRSSTTVSAMIVVIRIGHMIGPPFLKLSIRKLELKMPGLGGAGVGEAAGLAVAATVGAGDSSVTGTDAPGLAKGEVGAAGFNGAAGLSGAAGVPVAGSDRAGLPVAGAAGVNAGGGGGGDVDGGW